MRSDDLPWVIVGECSFTALVVAACVSVGVRPARVVLLGRSHDVDPIAGLRPFPTSAWFARHGFYHHSWRRFLDVICRREGIPLSIAQDLAAVCGTERALVVAGLAQKLPSWILRRFGDSAFNVHPSLLPAFRGPQPEAQVILHGEALTGVTIQRVVDAIDGGPTVFQETIRLARGATVGALERVEARVAGRGLAAVLHHLGSKGGMWKSQVPSYFRWYEERAILDLGSDRSLVQALRALRLRPEGLAYWEQTITQSPSMPQRL